VKDITSNKYFIPGFAVATLVVVLLIGMLTQGWIVGASVPDDAVAVVDGESIPVAEFNKTLISFASQTAGEGGKPVAPDPPNFTKCIAAKKSDNEKLGNAALKKQCEQEWDQAKTQIMTSLVQQKWYELQAKEMGIDVSDEDVKARFEPLKQQSFPKDADYQKFLKDTGQTEADILLLVRSSMVKEKVEAERQSSPTPTTGEVKSEFDKNKDQYATPASRDINLVFNSDEGKVADAKAAIDSGDSWADVAKKYSQDSVSKENGGKFPGVTKGQFPEELDKVVFSAEKSAIVGPIKTQYGYYLFEVTKTTEGKQQSFNDAADQIRQTLQQTRTQEAQQKFQTEFTEKWRKKTTCAEAFLVPEVCGNAPEPEGATAETGS
jgi:foldase protein PrsA